MPELNLTDDFSLAYRFVTETNNNLFLTGKAGTGKTTFLRYLRENNHKETIVAAPTGVAAINAGGVTLHSLFQLPFAPFIPDNQKMLGEGTHAVNRYSLIKQIRFNKEKRKLLRNMELLIIDEASMVASHTVDAIDTILKSVRKQYQKPFGGVQVLFIGDLYQLPPVVKNSERDLLKNYYSSEFFFDSHVIRDHPLIVLELKKVFRQQDEAFVDILNQVRDNRLTGESLDLLNSRLKQKDIPDDEGYITLTTHNYQADAINERKLDQLDSRAQSFKAGTKGDFPEHLFPAAEKLTLKEGAQVMFLTNDNEYGRYYNGKIGTITKLEEEEVWVQCPDDHEAIRVVAHEWRNLRYKQDKLTGNINEEVTGVFSQVPLRLAWAITIHKSQGLTFEKLIIDAEKAFATGQMYVALSRCTSLEGLILSSPLNKDHLGAYQSVKNWQSASQDDRPEDTFRRSRGNYALQELQRIFDWQRWQEEVHALEENIKAEAESLSEKSSDWIAELKKQQQELTGVAETFKGRIMALSEPGTSPEENEKLQSRVKDAAQYFLPRLKSWQESFLQHPLSTDTKRSAKKLDDSLKEINRLLHEAIHQLDYCQKGFELARYLKAGKKPTGLPPKIAKTYGQSQTANISPDELEHHELYTRIAQMRSRIGNETGMPLYRIFTNDAIKNTCVLLPGNKEALLKVKGFGKVKVEEFGDEVVEIVQTYCREKEVDPLTKVKKAKKPKSVGKSDTVEETLKLFSDGKTVDEIARQRDLVPGTIESHLAKAIQQGKLEISKVLEQEVLDLIRSEIPENGGVGAMTEIKKKCPESVSYGMIRMVLADRQRKQGLIGEV